MEITGMLRNARRAPKGDDVRAPCLHGQVYGDTRGRFCDGEWITTSTIMEEDGDVFRTRYSTYRVESWQGQPANDNTPKPPLSICLRLTATQQAARPDGTRTRRRAWPLSATCLKCSA